MVIISNNLRNVLKFIININHYGKDNDFTDRLYHLTSWMLHTIYTFIYET
jgi:hypothetical protein